jgi:hypothetical protein
MAVFEQLKLLSPERFLAIYQALSQKGYGPLDGEIAKLLKFRPQAIKKLPLEKRAKTARSLLEGRERAELCYELFGTYLVQTRKDLVERFLDATGVPHEDGMIEDIDAARPDPAKLDEAVAALDREFDPEDVTLYLALCCEQWPSSAELERLWRERSGAPVRTETGPRR